MALKLIGCCWITKTFRKGLHQGWRELSYLHNVGKDSLRATTVGRLLERAAAKYDSRDAIVSRHQGRSLTFEEALRESDMLAAGLRKTGLNMGDRVGIWAPNMVEWYIGMMACARGGFIMVAINPAYQESEIEFSINKVGVKGLICAHTFKTQNYYEILHRIASDMENCEPGKLKSARMPSLQTVVVISDEQLKGTYQYNEVMDMSDATSIKKIAEEQHLIQTDDGCNIQFTSGTTGNPKAALLSHFNLINNSYGIAKRNELDTKHHKICMQVPFFHAFGTVISATTALQFGSTIVLPGFSFKPKESLDAIKKESCTIIHGTPTMYVDLIKAQKEQQEDIHPEIAAVGGSPCSPQLFHDMIDVLGVKKVKSVYGLTETTAVVFQSLPNDDLHKITETVGFLVDHIEAKIIDSEGKILPRGKPGELCVRGYTTMLEYWGDDSKTKEMIGNDGWLRTGDKFVMQKDGYGRIVGRLKDMIIRGGENIYPKEIEDFLNTHPDILESQVIGLSHERLGEEVCACVRLKEGASSLSLEDLKGYCKGKISHFKVPSVLHILEDFPKTISGKVKKFKLREQIEKSPR